MSKSHRIECPYEPEEKKLVELLLMFLHSDTWVDRHRIYIHFMKQLKRVSQKHKRMYGLYVYKRKNRVI